MKEHPIIFSTDMVKAILEDRKTQTRRVIKPQLEHNQLFQATMKNGTVAVITYYAGQPVGRERNIKCPYGQVGDRLWVRETWAGQDFAICDEHYSPVYLGKDGFYHPVIHKSGKENYAWGLQGEPKWRSSRFMQKIATRIWLEITGVRAERLQEITREDALAEGCLFEDTLHHIEPKLNLEINWYRKLWDSLNAKRGYGWKTNCWVWVLTFKKV